jgi:hypothetical protein
VVLVMALVRDLTCVGKAFTLDVDTDLASVCRASIYIGERAWQASLPRFIIRLTAIFDFILAFIHT